MDDPADDILAATYRALCEYGYAELTMQRIADNSTKSKAALHYHYDTKDELLQAFLDYVADQFESELAAEAGDSSSSTAATTTPEPIDPEAQLRSIVATIFDTPEADHEAYATALLEIKAQAPYNDAYRERLRMLDRRVRRTITEAVRAGIEQGVFAEADPEEVARFVATATNGAHTREVAFGESLTETRALVESYLETELAISFDRGVPA
jgi:AcrR family transcriptional regulator